MVGLVGLDSGTAVRDQKPTVIHDAKRNGPGSKNQARADQRLLAGIYGCTWLGQSSGRGILGAFLATAASRWISLDVDEGRG